VSGSLTGLFGVTCLPGLTQIELSKSGRGQSPAVVLGTFAHVAARQLSANARPRRYDRIGSGKTLSVFPASPLQSGPAAFGQPRSFRANQTAGKQNFRTPEKGRKRLSHAQADWVPTQMHGRDYAPTSCEAVCHEMEDGPPGEAAPTVRR